MKIVRLNPTSYSCNCFVLGEEGAPAILIDCSSLGDRGVFSYIRAHHSALEGVFLTHGHFDHIEGIDSCPKGVPIFMGEEDIPFLSKAKYNASFFIKGEEIEYEGLSPYPLEDEDEIALPSFEVKIIHTPFHTPGSVCFYLPSLGICFTGDTLFARGIGRTDLRGGDPRLIRPSLEKLDALPKDTKIYPGHDAASTLSSSLRFAKAILD